MCLFWYDSLEAIGDTVLLAESTVVAQWQSWSVDTTPYRFLYADVSNANNNAQNTALIPAELCRKLHKGTPSALGVPVNGAEFYFYATSNSIGTYVANGTYKIQVYGVK